MFLTEEQMVFEWHFSFGQVFWKLAHSTKFKLANWKAKS